jgi:hypothetical protein
MSRSLITLALLCLVSKATAAGKYFEVTYQPSTDFNGFRIGVTYTLWLPDGVKTVRGIIVHQHGCGSGAWKGGETAAYDLHWQALAKKWDCALLGPSYHQDDKEDCRLWCDSRKGSSKAFLTALGDFSRETKHPEIETAPWCLWGHSGGGFWASLMQTKYPERIVAIWFRSGTAFSTWEKGEIEKPVIPDAAYGIPMMLNPGAKEKDDKRFSGAWTGSLAMLRAYRAKGAPAGFAADPNSSHDCGDSRYLAIPFFDYWLGMRLPEKGNKLKAVDMKTGWLADPLSNEAVAGSEYKGKADEAAWLPSEKFAKLWMDYVKNGQVKDTTPPPDPTNVKAVRKPDGTVEITWDGDADLESGLRVFLIKRDDRDIGQVPEKLPRVFQGLSYHDTPNKPLPEMKFIDKTIKVGETGTYSVIAVNGVGLKSKAVKETTGR